MIRGNEIEEQVYQPDHISEVLSEVERNFEDYFRTFALQDPTAEFLKYIEAHEKEQLAYQEYLHLGALDEFDRFDPNAFKTHTRNRCPIIRRCLMSHDETMKDYKKSFNLVSGRDLLDAVINITSFGEEYVAGFDAERHEKSCSYQELGLETLNQGPYGCIGVIGYGIQSSLLYGKYPHAFAHRSQNAVWSLYFFSGRKDFGLLDGSEFLMVHPEKGTCEQNYFYPAELFGFYALKLYLLLRDACLHLGITPHSTYRYIYLSAFCDHVANRHREHINTYKQNSEYVESHWF